MLLRRHVLTRLAALLPAAVLLSAPAHATVPTLVASYCAAGTVVQKVRFLGEHNETLLVGAPGAEIFLSQRFAGKQPVDSCPS